jgi:hypothetical protein
LQTYAEAMREPDRDFQYLRLWSLLELMAKNAIAGPPEGIIDTAGNPILDQKGDQITTKSALPKVYQYLRNAQHGDITIGKVVLPLWTVLEAAYAVRNGVAHEEAFDVTQNAVPGSGKALAIVQRKQPWDQVFDTLKSAAWLSVMRETN